ncbi:ketose-bisphosphate aldolase [Pediococcus acidilactici]|jgi:fructose-bisphosphate aldolase class II|uniref:ketose-bisphosphate aldolase n=1 Tax=Pediococcus acidilactici TaxID=1254 RepID=UPI00097E84BA|nr:ketose-bisphosphate aldolase [Pediococcus acidilactici]KAF0334012.1 ketose-bisphosphate aldolase [Pediococcus acidilactici]KAF0338463.1 ketose-bisphosphate aldolase [Pediococcus acidilactici]KAF0339487.1 ketose-bisphosphate aldolase [Pediococcus acidilactici]KAF0343697.1 ketose-bisphosphate aldolase [Pediococcus acidilactici]KAF0351431.1 ketose-bisphosphate aldolase [Pediococcus acidilactici]
MLYNTKDLLGVAYKNEFAVGSYNVANSEFVEAIIAAAEAKNAPAIIQIHPNEIGLVGENFIAYVRQAVDRTKIPMAIHVDHGGSLADCMKGIHNGYTSVMIDASAESWENNIAITKKVVEAAHTVGVSVEAELGTIGSNELSSENNGVNEILYTDPEDARKFVEETGVDTLAVAIGTRHGHYSHVEKPELRIDLLEKIHEAVDIPLVLHGGSDNKDSEIMKTYHHGVAKINLSTDMKTAFFKQLRKNLKEKPDAYEPDQLFPSARTAAQKVVEGKMDLFGSTGKASLYNI